MGDAENLAAGKQRLRIGLGQQQLALMEHVLQTAPKEHYLWNSAWATAATDINLGATAAYDGAQGITAA